jgi:hypothetical protein
MNPYQDLFDAQKAYFQTNVTRTLEWRIEQLDRMAGLLAANEKRLQKAIAADFKTAPQEYVLETLASGIEAEYQKSQLKNWMAPIERAAGLAPPLPALRFAAHHGTRRDARHHDHQGRGHRLQRVVPPSLRVVCRTTQALGQPGRRCHPIRR